MKILSSILLVSSLMLSGCGGDDLNELIQNNSGLNNESNDSKNNETNQTSNAAYITGQVVGHDRFYIPCDNIKINAVDSQSDYMEYQMESTSTGVVFRIILPTKVSLYNNVLGRYKVLSYQDVNANSENKFRTYVKVPYGDITTGERFLSNESYETSKYYTELVSVIEESKKDGVATLLLKFKFNLEMSHYKAGVLQANSELNNGELSIRVLVKDS